SAAAVMMPAAKTMLYALMVHCSVSTLPPRSRWIDGSAVTTTSVSSVTMKYATAVTATVSGCRPPPAGAAAACRTGASSVLMSRARRCGRDGRGDRDQLTELDPAALVQVRAAGGLGERVLQVRGLDQGVAPQLGRLAADISEAGG